jgi:class 3 adenylate cyclase
MLSLSEFKNKLSAAHAVQWVPDTGLEFFWNFRMRASREELWAYLSDTSRFNRELGFAPRTAEEVDGKVKMTTTMLGIQQEWIEEPWSWVTGQTIVFTRNYLKGMAKSVQSVFHIEDGTEPGTRVVYIYFGWKPASMLWSWFLRATDSVIRRKFGENFAKVDEHLADVRRRHENAFRAPPPVLSERALSSLGEVRKNMSERGLNARVVNQLCDYVTTGDDLDLESIRVLPLAKSWGCETNELLGICLHATRLGLLKISWEVICPHCRGSRFSAGSLGDIPESSDCGVCEIDFSTSEAESIEVVFHVHQSIRKVQQMLYCAAEPAKKSHIKVQQLLKPGQKLEISAELREGLHRARFAGDPREFKILVDAKDPTAFADLNRAGDLSKVGPSARLRCENPLARESLFVVEELVWDNTALKPAQVLALPEFRDLFSEEHLNANVKLFLGDQAILFSDIVGSTKFYTEVGDAKAFAEVRTHFQEVFQEVKACHGVVVKTIGDAVMASFPSTMEALTAAVAIQRRFHGARTDTRIRLRISVHSGPVIAVHLNTGIDYFGNTVNFAAKIQGCAGAGEIAVSELVQRTHRPEEHFKLPLEKRRSENESVGNAEVYVLNVNPPAGKIKAS